MDIQKKGIEERPSFWLTQVEISPNPPLEGEISVDFAILGGGFTGIATSYFLKKLEPSSSVAVLEQKYVGYGASGRNAGFCMTLFGLDLSLTVLRYGKENALAGYKYTSYGIDLVKRLVEEHKIDCDFEYNGFIRVATSKLYERKLKKEFELALKIGIQDATWLDKSKLEEKVSSPVMLGGWYERHCALLNPAKLVLGMKKVVEEMGVKIYENTPFYEVERRNDKKFVIKTSHGKVIADKIVFATNAFSITIPQLKRKQVPVFTHIVITEPLKEEHFQKINWRSREGLEDSRNLIHYFRLTKDNRLLMGGRDVTITFGSNLNKDMNYKVFEGLKEDIKKFFPPLSDLKIDYMWGGSVSVTLDLVPAIGYVGDKNAIYSLGCIGHGVSLTHVNGLTIAELLLEKDTERTNMFFVNRFVTPFPPEPLRFVVSHAIKAVLKLQDAIYDRI
jgi:glycine/D-amino acid oxidase-like deaminating enzyme